MSQSRAGLQSLPRPFPSLSFVCVSGKNILVHILHLIINRSIISASLTFLSLSSRRHVYLSQWYLRMKEWENIKLHQSSNSNQKHQRPDTRKYQWNDLYSHKCLSLLLDNTIERKSRFRLSRTWYQQHRQCEVLSQRVNASEFASWLSFWRLLPSLSFLLHLSFRWTWSQF